MKLSKIILGSAVALIAAPLAFASGPTLDPSLPKYVKVDGVRGTLSAAGSDTMLELQTLMAEEFRKIYPQVKVQVEGKGSSTAPPALIEGTVQLGDMSRTMKNKEIDAFEEAFGYDPTRFDVALDTLAVFVNKDNPIKSLTIEQVDEQYKKVLTAFYSQGKIPWYYTKFTLRHPAHFLRLLNFAWIYAKFRLFSALRGSGQGYGDVPKIELD